MEAGQSMEAAQKSGATAHQPILRRIDLLHRSDQHQRVTGLQAQIRRPLQTPAPLLHHGTDVASF
jgi:hypothetical protein